MILVRQSGINKMVANPSAGKVKKENRLGSKQD